MQLSYSVAKSPFGLCLLAKNKDKFAYLAFIEKAMEAEGLLKKIWPEAELEKSADGAAWVKEIFELKKTPALHIEGTEFQKKVWEALCQIPAGKAASYTDIAKRVGSPRAVRAVGTACGKNKIAYLIPCHRVLASNGKIGGYRWGVERKKAMLAQEGLQSL